MEAEVLCGGAGVGRRWVRAPLCAAAPRSPGTAACPRCLRTGPSARSSSENRAAGGQPGSQPTSHTTCSLPLLLGAKGTRPRRFWSLRGRRRGELLLNAGSAVTALLWEPPRDRGPGAKPRESPIPCCGVSAPKTCGLIAAHGAGCGRFSATGRGGSWPHGTVLAPGGLSAG